MKRRILLLYIFIILINSFLILPVLYYPVIFIPLHFLVTFISFDYLCSSKQFDTKWDKTSFAIWPCISQATIATIIVVLNDDVLIYPVLTNMIIFLYFLGISCVDFFIIRWRFDRYRKKRHSA